jgi:D-alanyl-D-alanine carboxypeptidase
MNDNEPYIIETPQGEPATSRSFPVGAQLIILGLILAFIFAGYFVPKTIALLKHSDTTAALSQSEGVVESTPATKGADFTVGQLKARSVHVLDVTKGETIYAKNPDEVLPLASITKLMTALTTYELIPDDKSVTISSAAAGQLSGGGMAPGEKFKAKELADFALISSYNSAAYTLATAVGELLGDRDPVAQFVAAMNIKSSEIGLTKHEYLNPTGLDESLTKAGAYGTARETSKLVEYILKNYPQILTPTITPATRLYNQNGDFHEARNTNSILSEIPNLMGSKTGYTDLAGGNLTIVFDAGYNRPIIITVLGSTHSERFADVEKLIKASQEYVKQN